MQQKKMNDQKLTENLKKIKHKIIVLSGKGGVGKSTVSAYLAYALSEKGHMVGILDSDLHGPTIPKILGIEDEKPQGSKNGFKPVDVSENLKAMSMGLLLNEKDTPVIWRGPMKMGAIRQLLGDVEWGELDFLIIDLPPGTGDEPLSVIQLIPDSDGAVVVTTPQDVALVSVRKSINFVKKMNIDVIGIVENMSGFICPNCKKEINIFKKDGGKNAAEDLHVDFLGSIPIEPNIVLSADKGEPLFEKSNKFSNSKAGTSFKKIVEKIEENIKNKKELNENA